MLARHDNFAHLQVDTKGSEMVNTPLKRYQSRIEAGRQLLETDLSKLTKLLENPAATTQEIADSSEDLLRQVTRVMGTHHRAITEVLEEKDTAADEVPIVMRRARFLAEELVSLAEVLIEASQYPSYGNKFQRIGYQIVDSAKKSNLFRRKRSS